MQGLLAVLTARLPLSQALTIALELGVVIALVVALGRPLLVAVRAGDTAALRRYSHNVGRFMLRVTGILALLAVLAAVLLLIR